MVNKLSLMGRYRKVVLRNKRSGSACPIALAKIKYKIRKEKRKSVLIEVYSNKLKTELSKAYLQL